MAQTDWLNLNDYRDYPLAQDGDFSLSTGGKLPRLGIADAGFVMGVASEFDHSDPAHDLYLHRVVRGFTSLTLIFRSDAPSFVGWEFQFPFADDDPRGRTVYADAVEVATAITDVCRGTGFLVIGTLDELLMLIIDTHVLTAKPRVEQALVQSLADSLAKSVNIANDMRPCPPSCFPESPSSPSSVSSPSPASLPAGAALIPVAVAEATGLDGDVEFKPGWNSTIKLIQTDNAVEFGAGVGAGEGEPCADIRIEEDGLQLDESCEPCAGFIYSINGRGREQTHLLLAAGEGINIVPDPADPHGLIVAVDPEQLCADT